MAEIKPMIRRKKPVQYEYILSLDNEQCIKLHIGLTILLGLDTLTEDQIELYAAIMTALEARDL